MKGHYQRVYMYDDHLLEKHPVYRTWNRRLSALYLVPILLLFGSLPASIIAAVPPSGVNLSAVLLFWLLALLSGLLIIRVRGRGTKRFRESWIQEHGQPSLS